MPPMLRTAEQEAQSQFLVAYARYQAAKVEFQAHQLTSQQLQIMRDQYILAIERFAAACGVIPECLLSMPQR